MTDADRNADRRPLRSDAQRNRQQILDVAGAVFAEHGLDASFEEIARRAGVGVGTVYRRFPDREDLIDALFEQRIEEVLTVAKHAADQPVAWTAMTEFLQRSLEMQVADRGLKQVLANGGHGRERLHWAKERLTPVIDGFVARAHAEGSLRPDVSSADLGALTLMLSSISFPDHPELWRRYITIVLDGLRAQSGCCTPLPLAAPEEHVLACMADDGTHRRH